MNSNSRNFPSTINSNFKKYILDEVKNTGDPCNEVKIVDNKKKSTKEQASKYQDFIASYLNYDSNNKDILVWHGVGSGKTMTTINYLNELYKHSQKWNFVIIIPAGLHDDPWLSDITKFLINEPNYNDIIKSITFIHYDSPTADRQFIDAVKALDSSKTTVYIIDEAHRFINNVYNNISGKGKGRRGQIIYDYIQNEKKENSNTRILLLSATPVVNRPFEYALIFNLLRPGCFPTSESIFEQLFISSTNFASLNEETKNMFQRRIMGLVSYYIGATPDKFASKTIHYVNLQMDSYFEEIYNYFEDIEEKKEKLRLKMSRGKVGDNMATYSSYTRQACNFIFPIISEKVNGEKRPRPSHFKIKDTDAIIVTEGKNLEKKNQLVKSKAEVLEYMKTIRMFVNEFIDFLKKSLRKDKEENYTLSDDVKKFKTTYNGNFTEFIQQEKKISNLLKLMNICSPKFVRIIFNIFKTKGTVMIYSNYVEMEGLQILKVYLSFFGFISIDDDKEFKTEKDGLRYCEFHGGVDRELRKNNKIIFNKSENKYGKFCKIIMISPAGTEGINLNNVRQVHIIEPYWNEVRIEQVIGRALRYCQHKDLPMDERHVDIFRYKMVRKNGKITTDEKMEEISRKKNNLLISFMEAVKEVAVDCEIFREHNMMGSKYKCFQFNEDSLFEKPIGPIYNTKIEYDQKMNNGSNSKDSTRLKIKVRKIKAVKRIDEQTLSLESFYWLYDESGVVYDYDLYFPVGKLERDLNNNITIIDNDLYVISDLINIPKVNIY